MEYPQLQLLKMSNNGEFGGSGNGNNVDYDVEVTLNLNTGSSFTLDATFSWREPSSGNIAIIGLEFKNNVESVLHLWIIHIHSLMEVLKKIARL